MKDYQLYLEKIVNALSRAGISYPAPSFTTYEGMWSYVEGLGSFLEMNAQLQKSGAGVVLMGLEESTTFKTYWNSEFYQEFQERKLLESKISFENEESESQEDYAESMVTHEAENLTETASSENHLTEVVTGLVVGSVASSSNGLDMSNVIFSDDDEDEEDSDYEGEPLMEEGDFDLAEEEDISNSDLATSGFDMSNVVFSDDEDDDEEDDFIEDDSSDDFYDVDFEEDFSDEDDFKEEEFVNDSSEESLHGVSKEELSGYDFSNVILSDDEDKEESLSEDEEDYEYDEDGFIIDNSEPEEDDEEDDFLEEEDEYEYDEDGFIIDRSEPEEDDDEEEFFDEEEDEYEYDEDGFIIDRSEPEEDDDEDEEFYEDTSDGYTYDEDGFVIDDDEPIVEDEDDNFEDNVVPIQPHQVNPPREMVSKPKPVRPKELQETDKILSIFGSLEGKLRKKVKDVKDKSKN